MEDSKLGLLSKIIRLSTIHLLRLRYSHSIPHSNPWTSPFKCKTKTILDSGTFKTRHKTNYKWEKWIHKTLVAIIVILKKDSWRRISEISTLISRSQAIWDIFLQGLISQKDFLWSDKVNWILMTLRWDLLHATCIHNLSHLQLSLLRLRWLKRQMESSKRADGGGMNNLRAKTLALLTLIRRLLRKSKKSRRLRSILQKMKTKLIFITKLIANLLIQVKFKKKISKKVILINLNQLQ